MSHDLKIRQQHFDVQEYRLINVKFVQQGVECLFKNLYGMSLLFNVQVIVLLERRAASLVFFFFQIKGKIYPIIKVELIKESVKY